MQMNLPLPKQIYHSSLPGEVVLGFYMQPSSDKEATHSDLNEGLSGSHFIRKLAEIALSVDSLQLVTKKNEKPRAFFGLSEYSVSFSHTRRTIAGAISASFNVGCDLESSERKVSESLVKRMMSPNEKEGLYRENPAVRIWTCKEAVLKMTGTGLRKPMAGVTLSQESGELFTAEIDDAFLAKICSFQYRGHWIAVCFKKDVETNSSMQSKSSDRNPIQSSPLSGTP